MLHRLNVYRLDFLYTLGPILEIRHMPVGASPSQERLTVLSSLPSTFTLAQARASGLTKYALYTLRDQGEIEALGRGLFRRADAELADLDLLAVAFRAPRATLCLTTALVRHGLSDAIPAAPDLALPRGTRAPAVSIPVAWHHFERSTFDVGRETFAIDTTTSFGVYSVERSIVDAFRLRGSEGPELGYEALRRWLRRPDSSPQRLVGLANHWPRVLPSLRHALEVLL